MGRKRGKSSRGFEHKERGKPGKNRSSDTGRGRRGSSPSRPVNRFARPSAPADATLDAQALLAALATIAGGGTAGQIAASLDRQEDTREIAVALRRLVQQGQVLEVRPGRYQISGTGGEFAVTLERDAGARDGEGVLVATFPDQRTMRVNPAYTLGAGAGDVCQVLIGEDDQALVTRILRRDGREVVGTVNFKPGGAMLVCDNRREGMLPILSAFPRFYDKYQAGERVVGTIEVDGGGSAGVNITRILGKATPEVADFEYVCLAHGLPGAFPAEVDEQAASYRDELPLGDREDLRQKLVFTIDPATAKDFDDAISLERDDQGRRVLGVHIADVSHYVREQTPLDAEAAARGTSIYLINRVIPMLPETLSNGLCSLVPHRDRYCLSAFLTLDGQGNLINTRLAETMINSRHRFTYEEALEVLDGKDPAGKWPADVRQVLRDVSTIAQNLRRARGRAGALNLFSVEHRFKLDVNGVPIEVGQETTDISHQLIEECMLLANRAVAKWIEDQGLPCVNRIHEAPDPERLEQFARVLEAYGLDSSKVQNRFGLQRLLADLDREPPAAKLVLNFLCLRSFKKAAYSIDNIGHHALAFSHYAHFTSPIRRYPDLLVHRMAKRGLKLAGYLQVEVRRSYLDALARQSSYLEQRAESAERDLHARKSARYLANRIGDIFPGVVTGAAPNGLFVQLMETGMDGMLPVRELRDDFYNYDPEAMALVGRRSGRVIGVGTEIDVQVAAVDIERADVVLGFPSGVFAAGGAIGLKAGPRPTRVARPDGPGPVPGQTLRPALPAESRSVTAPPSPTATPGDERPSTRILKKQAAKPDTQAATPKPTKPATASVGRSTAPAPVGPAATAPAKPAAATRAASVARPAAAKPGAVAKPAALAKEPTTGRVRKPPLRTTMSVSQYLDRKAGKTKDVQKKVDRLLEKARKHKQR